MNRCSECIHLYFHWSEQNNLISGCALRFGESVKPDDVACEEFREVKDAEPGV